jgi:hypothetical protein
MGHNTPAPVIPALGGAYGGEGATPGEVSLRNNLFQTRYTTLSTSFSLLEVVDTTPTTPICDGVSFVPNCAL